MDLRHISVSPSSGACAAMDTIVGVAVDPADPDTVIVSATDGPGSAYWPRSAKAYSYRRTGLKRWEQAMSGLPEAKGTTASQFATHAGEPGVIYAANNRGLFRSDDAGRSWKALDLPWSEPGLADGVEALACLLFGKVLVLVIKPFWTRNGDQRV